MLSFSPIEKPKIDIELYGTDINIAPIDKVHIMDEDSFEHFTLEWLYGCKKDKYSSIMRIGGAGDKGRDVIAYRKDGGVDYFQCKHYNSALAPSNYYLELGKLCYYTYTKDIPLPKSYYIVASNDIGPTLQDLLDNSAQLLSSLLDNWDTYCRFKITKSKEIKVKDYFDYSFVSEFGKWIKLFLEDCKYPNLTSLIFDKATMDIVLNGKKKSANGKGYNAYLNSAVAIVLSRYMQKHAHYAPGLILLDSPILSLKEIDTQKPSQSMRSGLFENIASTSEGIQTIVIENEIPEIDYSNVNLIHFTKNANTGRYGFLIDVMD